MTENIEQKLSTGLVCEGGGMRGIYTAGVLDVLGENGVGFDGIVGVSAGAIHATSFKAGQHGRSVRFYLAYCADPRFMGLRSWIKTGDFVNYNFCYHEIPEELVPLDFDAYEASKTDLYMTCTNVETGQPYYHLTPSLRGKNMEILRASASLPVMSRIVEFEGLKLLDGGTADSIPLRFMQDKGYKKIVVILTRPAGYRKTPESNPIFNFMYRRYPEFVECLRTRHECYNAEVDRINELEKAGEIFVFRPDHMTGIKRLERNAGRIVEMYELGRHDATNRLDELRRFLNL